MPKMHGDLKGSDAVSRGEWTVSKMWWNDCCTAPKTTATGENTAATDSIST